jgi:hypothetical protein
MGGMASVFVVSDIHGHRDDLLEGLVEFGLASEDGEWIGKPDAQLWILGDLTDRGPDGIGVVDLVMSLQEAAPDQVHVLMGNHEALTLGMARFPDSRFVDSWIINGGLLADQVALTDRHLQWLASLPLVARFEDYLFLHSDTTSYLGWGSSVDEINETVRGIFASADDLDGHWDVWVKLTSRYHFARRGGTSAARTMLGALGGKKIVHGHSIIGTLINRPSEEVSEPVQYADGQVLAIDGGRYDGGPLLVVRLQ